MRIVGSLLLVIILILIAYFGAGVAQLNSLFGIVIPYFAFAIFLLGFLWKLLKWGRSYVPFRIPTTGGQQKSLKWIKWSKLDNPSTPAGVVGRMILEIFLMRSLFRNTRSEIVSSKLVHGSSKWLWIGAMAFHWAFFIVLIRHMRLFIEPVPGYVHLLESLDGFFQIGQPRLMMTGVILIGAGVYLFLRRWYIPQVRYMSLPADYFPLFLIIAIATTGVLMRYFSKTDIVAVKTLLLSLMTLSPEIPEKAKIDTIFYIHLFLVSILLAYFPFSKLMHLGGIFMSPTRNMANNLRFKRHVNPWDYPVKVHHYEEYENEFRDKMKAAGIPVEKE
ncbi:MAG: sulfate reduction electron transfer complex DsrMKJOP subunit DsrM [Thermodesulfovibrionales bacterium]|nr:sulfate reduction electron transfer complex DsrMKJOP subunit DsrM [Thermodesulfovibrionales bacterium]